MKCFKYLSNTELKYLTKLINDTTITRRLRRLLKGLLGIISSQYNEYFLGEEEFRSLRKYNIIITYLSLALSLLQFYF